MKEGARYVKIVEWSEEEQCFVGIVRLLTLRQSLGFARDMAQGRLPWSAPDPYLLQKAFR